MDSSCSGRNCSFGFTIGLGHIQLTLLKLGRIPRG
ncbi:Bgt-51273 [Blumeria graminis f. sp. tritici]|uniref:Bgt-51273 n=1 Tax=Blumeria graminis f. sp. tritici TaxID=62690 RepID=A0A9X9PQL4_BLUGR|nr:Bgt-51273 [Blumeria graminis f. sp. tritici]